MKTNQMMTVKIGNFGILEIGHKTMMGKVSQVLEMGNRNREAKNLEPVKLRLTNWNQAIRMINNNPFFGVGIGNFVGSFLSAQSAIPIDWVIIGISMCITVGLIFGTYPAYKAANLDPKDVGIQRKLAAIIALNLVHHTNHSIAQSTTL